MPQKFDRLIELIYIPIITLGPIITLIFVDFEYMLSMAIELKIILFLVCSFLLFINIAYVTSKLKTSLGSETK